MWWGEWCIRCCSWIVILCPVFSVFSDLAVQPLRKIFSCCPLPSPPISSLPSILFLSSTYPLVVKQKWDFYLKPYCDIGNVYIQVTVYSSRATFCVLWELLNKCILGVRACYFRWFLICGRESLCEFCILAFKWKAVLNERLLLCGDIVFSEAWL